MNDNRALLEAFGSPCRVKGFEYRGILEDDYATAEVGRSRLASNSIEILFSKTDIVTMGLSRDESFTVYDAELDTWSTLVVKSIQPRTDGFSLVRCVEAT